MPNTPIANINKKPGIPSNAVKKNVPKFTPAKIGKLF